MSQIKDLLEKARGWILLEGGVVCPHKFGICKHDNENCPVFCLDQALTLLKQQPTAGEFTKELRRRVTEYRKLVSPFAQDTISILSRAAEACDRLDTAEAINKELLEALEKYGNHIYDCATNSAEVCDEFNAMGCTCGLRDIIAKAKRDK